MTKFSNHELLRHMREPSHEETLRDSGERVGRIRFREGEQVPIKTSTRIGVPDPKERRDA